MKNSKAQKNNELSRKNAIAVEKDAIKQPVSKAVYLTYKPVYLGFIHQTVPRFCSNRA